MYVLKKVIPNSIIEPLYLEDMVCSITAERKLYILEKFWGVITVTNLDELDIINDTITLNNIKEFSVENLENDRKEFKFNVSKEMNDKIDGYILFVYPCEMDTNGEILFSKKDSRGIEKAVVVLREGNYIEIYDDILTVKDGQLCVNN